MDDSAGGKTPPTLDEKLTSYRELCDRRQALGDRLRKLEESRETVSERIYEKVQGEYREELRKIDGSLEPLKGEIESQRRQVEQEMDALAQAISTLEDELAEADLRHRVGEYTEDQIAEFRRRVQPRLETERERARHLEDQISAFHERRAADRPTIQALDPVPEPASAPEPVLSASADDTPSGLDEFADPSVDDFMENPQSWADENELELDPEPEMPTMTPARKPKPAPAATAVEELEDDEDPLAALADPDTQKRPPVNPGRPAPEGQPALYITAGPHADKTILLLPMTMTIGREHDNNIELKDPDVARYHARIVYEGGHYSIEDLEGSTGTLINGEKVRRAPLQDGDHIQIGQTMLIFSRS